VQGCPGSAAPEGKRVRWESGAERGAAGRGEALTTIAAITPAPKLSANHGRAVLRCSRARARGWAEFQRSRNTVIMVLGKFST